MKHPESQLERSSGILLHISSLPSRHGIGDLGPEAYRFADLLSRAGSMYWQVLPINPTQEGGCNSPYFSASSSAGNPLLVSLERLYQQQWCTLEEDGASPENSANVDYHAVTLYKYGRLAAAFQEFRIKGEQTAFTQFCAAQKKWLDNYALFITLKEKFGGQPWNEWPDALRYREPDALAQAVRENEDAVLREKWYQYLFFSQWNELKEYCTTRGIKIIGDIPIYVSYDSVDVWAHPENYKLDGHLRPTGVSGVPPDYFSETGQLWNNPVYNWDTHKKSGFSWWIERMTMMLERFDVVRIDHFRGLVQYWEVPAGEATALNGVWQPVPTYEFFDTLKNSISPCNVIAEDLGIITDDVKVAMNHYHFPGMKLLQFAFNEDDPWHPYLPHMYTRNCLVYAGTHDNNTIRGWFEDEADDATRQRFMTYTELKDDSIDAIVWAMISLALKSVADCAVIAAQDLFVLDRSNRMNTPSVAHGNWGWRLTSAQMEQFPVERLAGLNRLYGRTGQ